TLRPAVRRSDRGGRPVERARQLAHFPAAGEEIRSIRSLEIQHQDNWPARPTRSRNYPACHGSANVPTSLLVPINFRELGTKSEMRARALYFISPAAVSARV